MYSGILARELGERMDGRWGERNLFITPTPLGVNRLHGENWPAIASDVGPAIFIGTEMIWDTAKSTCHLDKRIPQSLAVTLSQNLHGWKGHTPRLCWSCSPSPWPSPSLSPWPSYYLVRGEEEHLCLSEKERGERKSYSNICIGLYRSTHLSPLPILAANWN